MVTRQKRQAKPLTADDRSAIRALRPAFNVLMRAFDEDLMRSHGLSHTEYLVLMFLAEAENRTLRLTDLAAVCQQSLSAVSRTVGRLEAVGLVRREQAAQDARSFNAVLTDNGLGRLEAARPSHLDSVRKYFFANLGEVDVRALADALERIAKQGSAPRTSWGEPRVGKPPRPVTGLRREW
jgi:DNA-binding MarR family transcriptional regulator